MDKIFTVNCLIFCLVGVAGLIAHAIKKWLNHEIGYSVYAYLFQVDQRGSLLTLLTVLGGVLGMVGSGQIGNLHAFADISAAFLYGLGCDSFVSPVNKGHRQ